MFLGFLIFVLVAIIGVGAVIVLSIQDTRYRKELRDEMRRMRRLWQKRGKR
ncbi:MAG: hypothetical protein IKF90_10145 [Parasporobacterium sp.]|nr:hypothetical protein [Parasporobacterium sp.]